MNAEWNCGLAFTEFLVDPCVCGYEFMVKHKEHALLSTTTDSGQRDDVKDKFRPKRMSQLVLRLRRLESFCFALPEIHRFRKAFTT